ncbi:MAG TPA: F0F1 ATP synthase subunit alpha [Planctomycetota bacterium]|nr:F0F1 ATP synthase subunit alpha [Planctomycetota bacterium]
MKIKADEIASVLRKEIEDYARDLEMDEVGSILEVGDGIARVYGLKNVMAGELLEFPKKVMGLALNLEETSVGVVLLGDYTELREGDQVKRTRKVMSVPAGEAMIGRVVNPLGEPLDNKGPIDTKNFRPMEMIAPGIAARQPVNEPLQTGLKAIDSMIPIGRGQRELIIGDRQTGKTAIAIDTIINQKGQGVICIYVAIGQKSSTTAAIVERLRNAGAMDYTVVVQAGASDPAPLQYIAPYAGVAIGEYFMYEKGGAVLCVYDDLSKQASAYRELALLLRRPPGREAYPGDVFYLHSRLLERAVKMKDLWIIVQKSAPQGVKEGLDGIVYERPMGKDIAEHVIKGFNPEKFEVRQYKKGEAIPSEVGKWGIFQKNRKVAEPHLLFDDQATADRFFKGRPDKDQVEIRRLSPSGGSLTALPIIETQEGEVSAYIPTNVISITDGQIYLEPNLFFSGIRPAINVGISVSRVGGNAQTKAMKSVAGSLRLDLASYWDLEAFAQLGTELDAVSQRKLDRGKRMVELLKQGQYAPLPFEEQVTMIYGANEGFLDQIAPDKVQEFERKFLPYMRQVHPEVLKAIRESKVLSDDSKTALKKILGDFVTSFKGGSAPDPRSGMKA